MIIQISLLKWESHSLQLPQEYRSGSHSGGSGLYSCHLRPLPESQGPSDLSHWCRILVSLNSLPHASGLQAAFFSVSVATFTFILNSVSPVILHPLITSLFWSMNVQNVITQHIYCCSLGEKRWRRIWRSNGNQSREMTNVLDMLVIWGALTSHLQSLITWSCIQMTWWPFVLFFDSGRWFS